MSTGWIKSYFADTGEAVMINANNIIEMHQVDDKDDKTVIKFVGDNNYIEVKERLMEVYGKISG
jgi:hypothetical protein